MKLWIKIAAALLAAVLLAACGKTTVKEPDSTAAEPSVQLPAESVPEEAKPVRQPKTEAELKEELEALYKENDCVMFMEEYGCTYEQNGFRVTVYSFLNAEYSEAVSIVCRFKDDVLLDYVVADKDALKEAKNDPEGLTFYALLDYTANEDMSQIEMYNIYSGTRCFAVDFAAGSFRYVKKEGTDAQTRLEAMTEEERVETLKNEYLIPFIEAGLAGDYYCDTDRITKMLDYYGQNNTPPVEAETDSDGTLFAFVPRETVLAYLETVFQDTDQYVFEYNDRYDKKQDAFKIYFTGPRQELPYTVTVEQYDAGNYSLSVDCAVTDTQSGTVTKMYCRFGKRKSRYLFDQSALREEEAEGRYTLSQGEGEGGGDSWIYDVILTDNLTGKTKNLGREFFSNAVSDYGFFANGDVYVMNYTGLTVYDTNMDNPSPVFTTKTNFPCSRRDEIVSEQGTTRFMLAIRRDPVTYEYIVVYCEYVPDDDYDKIHVNDFQLCCNYRIGLLDREGNLTKSWDTGVPAMFTVFGFENVRMKKVGENEYEMFVNYKSELRLSGRFDTVKETYTPIKIFELYN